MADKKLTIALKADVRDGQKFQKFLSDLAAQGNRTAKALSGISIGGDTPTKRAALSKALLDQKKMFEALGGSGRHLAKILEQDVGKATEALTTKLEKVNRHLKDIINEHRRAEGELSRMKLALASTTDPGERERLMRGISSQEELVGFHRERATRAAGEREGIASDLSQLQGPGPGKNALLQALASVFRGLAPMAVAYAGLQGMQEGARMYTEMGGGWGLGLKQAEGEARYRQSLAGHYRGAMRGDLKEMFAADLIASYSPVQTHPDQVAWARQVIGGGYNFKSTAAERKRAYQILAGQGGPTVGPLEDQLRKSTNKTAIGIDASASGLMDALGKVVRINFGGAGTSLVDAQIKRPEMAAENYARNIQAAIQQNPVIADMLDWSSANAASRLGMQRRFRLGWGGLNRFQDMAHGMGYDDSQLAGMMGGIQGYGGRRAAHQLTGLGLQGVGAGMDEGAVAQILGLGAVGGQSGRLLRSLGSSGMDVMAAQQIGQFVVGQLINGNSMTSGLGLQGAMMGGFTGGPGDRLIAAQNIAGMQGLGRIFGGQIDPFQGQLNVVNAAGILGSRATPNAIDKLSMGMDTRTLFDVAAGGKLPLSFGVRGITGDDARQFAQKTILDSLRTRSTAIFDQGTQGEVVREFLASGGDIRSFLQGKKGQDREIAEAALGTAFANAGLFSSDDAGIGAMRNMGRWGRIAKDGSLTDVGGPDREVAAGLLKAGDNLRKEIEKQTELVKMIEGYGRALDTFVQERMRGAQETPYTPGGVGDVLVPDTLAFGDALNQATGSVEEFKKVLDEARGVRRQTPGGSRQATPKGK